MSNGKVQPSFETNRIVLGECIPLDTPFTIIIDSSEVCNFKCGYCFRSMQKNEAIYGYTIKNNLMSMEVFEKILEQIKQFPQPLKRIPFSNHGEPLCNRNLPKMIRRIKEEGIQGKTEIHTNASLLDEKYAVELAESQIDKIVVSIQGIREEQYQKNCGVKIDFERYYNNLKILYESKTNTKIYIKTVDKALEQDDEMIFYERFGPIADRVFVEKVVPLFQGVDYDKINMEDVFQNKYGEKFGDVQCCSQVFYNLTVAPDGTIYPCAQPLVPFNLGKIQDITLLEAWNSQKRQEFLKEMLCKGRKQLDICRTCYVPQNTVKVKEDLIDSYRREILVRMDKRNG